MAGRRDSAGIDFDARPILVFWETTKACLLSCRHCRAEAIPEPLPGELSPAEGFRLLESLARFGRPSPILVLTGGDVLMRPDLEALTDRARELGMPVAVAPSVTPLLTPDAVRGLRERGVKVASLSLDGATAATHEGIRGVHEHLPATLAAGRLLRSAGMTLQINTVVMKSTVEELPAIASLVRQLGAGIWELFFLVQVGRGSDLEELAPEECEDVCHFLFDASRYGFVVRTVEAPFFRRVVAWRREETPALDPASAFGLGPLYHRLAGDLKARLGEPRSRSRAQTKGTRDGKGILFVAHDGSLYPSGFLPWRLGSVRKDDVVSVYREHPLLRAIRAGEFQGRCGACEYADLCGGSRARAFAATGDPLGEDPACPYLPARSSGREEVGPRR